MRKVLFHLLAIVMLVLPVGVNVQAQEVADDESPIFIVVEEQAEFPGGMDSLMQFVEDSLRYPQEALEQTWEGKVFCQFTVETDGSINSVAVIRSSGYEILDHEALRVLRTMPKWQPGKQKGVPVRVKYTMPIAFKIPINTLVVYFSATGNTRAAAEELAQIGKRDLYEITPVNPYKAKDLNWKKKKSRSTLEMNNPEARPEIMPMDISITQYDTIYIGFPIWWGICPRVIQTWIERVDLSGKVVIPFATSGGSTIDRAVAFLKETYPTINWAE